ncbi:MAG: DUF4825 domain-containing protein [Firmicutes bacterium]|nr:DUF4825 domain-containing protein [Bacillota bacterium]
MTGLLFNLTFIVTATTSVILFVKYLFRNKTPPRWQLLIWTVLAVQIFVFPFSENLPDSIFSIRNYIPEAVHEKNTVPAEYRYENKRPEKQDKKSGINKDDTFIQNGGNSVNMAADPEFSETVKKGDSNIFVEMPQGKQTSVNSVAGNVIVAVWALGMTVTVFVQIVRYVRCRKSLRECSECRNENILKLFEECKETLAIKKDIRVYTGEEATMLTGIINPAIYIKEDFEESEMKYVLMHELCHYRHMDVVWNLAASVYAVVFWFNPVIWLAFHTFRRDIEIYCDARAIIAANALAEGSVSASGSRREYARVLVKSAAGQLGFVPVTTSFIGGQKEVTVRVKRIAGFKKPRALFNVLSVILALLLLAACTTGALENASAVESVSVGNGDQINVPATWLSDMRKIVAADDESFTDNGFDSGLPQGSKQFFDKNGNLFAEIYNASDNVYTDEEIFDAGITATFPDMDPQTAKKAIIRHLENRGFSELEEHKLDTSAFQNESSTMRYNAFTAVKDGKKYNIAAAYYQFFVMIADAVSGDDGNEINNEKGEISLSSLAECLSTVRSSEYFYMQTAGLSNIDEFKVGNYELTDQEYEKYAKKTLNGYFDEYIKKDLPVEMKIKECRIRSIDEIVVKGERPKVANISLGAYYDDALWNVIYPRAKAYKISYEITPYNDKYFEGDRIAEEIAVFAVNDYIREEEGKVPVDQFGSPLNEFCFVGFVDKEDADYYGLDSAVLDMLNNWYISINPVYPSYYGTDYIGNAVAVGKIVNSLPLHEYIDTSEGVFSDKALVLQTSEEPFALTINYDFTKDSPLDTTDEIGLTPVSTRHKQILSSNLNAFVVDWVYTNMGRLFDNIGNLGILTVNLHYTENNELQTETITFDRSDRHM